MIFFFGLEGKRYIKQHFLYNAVLLKENVNFIFVISFFLQKDTRVHVTLKGTKIMFFFYCGFFSST